jgi:hypothetical protein
MKNLIQNIKNLCTPTYNVLYAPENSANCEPIQTYKVIGHPKNAAWLSNSGNRLFTLPLAGKNEIRSFRSERVLSVNFALF